MQWPSRFVSNNGFHREKKVRIIRLPIKWCFVFLFGDPIALMSMRSRLRLILVLGLVCFCDCLLLKARAQNRVLELDGRDACVELPANLFTNEVVTIEGWVKCREVGSFRRFFEFADAALMVGVVSQYSDPDVSVQRYA